MANTLVDEVVKYIQIANPYRGLGLSMLPVCRVGYGTGRLHLSTNSKPLPGLILRLLNLTPIRQVGASFVRMTHTRLLPPKEGGQVITFYETINYV
jgi:hypothetical protein